MTYWYLTIEEGWVCCNKASYERIKAFGAPVHVGQWPPSAGKRKNRKVSMEGVVMMTRESRKRDREAA